jgi:hypothetical protein
MIRTAFELLSIGSFIAMLAILSGLGTETVQHHRAQASISKVRS